MLAALADHLESQGVGVVGQDIYRHRLPDTPDRAMVLAPYGGAPGPRVHDATQAAYRIERIQIMCRDTARSVATAMANAAYDVVWLTNATLGDRTVIKSEPLQPPFDLPEDERNRAIVVFNLEVWSV